MSDVAWICVTVIVIAAIAGFVALMAVVAKLPDAQPKRTEPPRPVWSSTRPEKRN